jgi:hypothetical protein
MAYLTHTILEAAHGTDEVTALTGGSASTLAALIDSASSEVRKALMVGGYTAAVPETVYLADGSDCPTEIRTLAERVWKRHAYARRDLSIPTDQVETLDELLAEFRDGRAEIKDVSRSTARAPGGFLGTDASLTSTDSRARPPIMSRSRMSGF